MSPTTAGFEISLCRSFSVSVARSSELDISDPPPRDRIFAAQVALVLGKLFGELRHLENDGRAERGYDRDREQHGHDDRGYSPQAPAAQPPDERRQNEPQQRRDDERLEDLPAHVEENNDERRDDQAARHVAEAMSGHSRRSQTEPVHSLLPRYEYRLRTAGHISGDVPVEERARRFVHRCRHRRGLLPPPARGSRPICHARCGSARQQPFHR